MCFSKYKAHFRICYARCFAKIEIYKTFSNEFGEFIYIDKRECFGTWQMQRTRNQQIKSDIIDSGVVNFSWQIDFSTNLHCEMFYFYILFGCLCTNLSVHTIYGFNPIDLLYYNPHHCKLLRSRCLILKLNTTSIRISNIRCAFISLAYRQAIKPVYSRVYVAIDIDKSIMSMAYLFYNDIRSHHM